MTPYDADSPLPNWTLAMLRNLVAYLDSGEIASAILAQAETATILRGSATMIDLLPPPDSSRIDLPNGPPPVRAFVGASAADPTGEILVWIRDGELIGLEQAWWTDDPPTEWPTAESVCIA